MRIVDRTITIVNVCIFIVLVHWSMDLAVFYLAYEVSTVVVLPLLCSSSRTVRRSYALAALYGVNMFGLIMFTGSIVLDSAVTSSGDAGRSAWLAVFLAMLVATKTPCYPFAFWLPEAHVECSYSGSVILAALVLKVSLVASLLWLLPTSDSARLILGLAGSLSVCWYSIGLAGCIDLKRTGAVMSIMHMTAGLLVLSASAQWGCNMHTELLIAHSVGALVWFHWVGVLYSRSGSRTALSAARSSLMVTWGTMAMAMLVIAPLPEGILFMPEVMTAWTGVLTASPLFLWTYGIGFIGILLVLASIISRLISKVDMKATTVDVASMRSCFILSASLYYECWWY